MINYIYKHFLKIFVDSRITSNYKIKSSKDIIVTKILIHQSKMSDFLVSPIRILAIFFLITYFYPSKVILRMSPYHIFNGCRMSNLFILRKLVRLHDSIFEIANVKDDTLINNKKIRNLKKLKKKYDFIIIGSGPSGCVSADELKKAGFEVLLIDSALNESKKIPEYSYSEMLHKYKNGGITATFGNSNIAYVEGSTPGGGSEVNSGLYHRIPEKTLNYWVKHFGWDKNISKKLKNYYENIEKKLSISHFPKTFLPKASLKLFEGAQKLGWSSQEVPRWFKFDNKNLPNGKRMTMNETYLKSFLNNGGHFSDGIKVSKIKKVNNVWEVIYSKKRKKEILTSKRIILCAGTISTAQILKKSKISKVAGRRFQVHPTIKVVALFDDKVNSSKMGVPVHQVKEFSPAISLGCSISSKPYLRIAMLDHFDKVNLVEKKWKNMAIYYAMITPEGFGRIFNLPFYKDPFVTYNLTKMDQINLARGLKVLSRLLLKSNAKMIFPSIQNGPLVEKEEDIKKLPDIINTKTTSLMTVHTFSSCPIGSNKKMCVANQYGSVYDHKGLYINDGSMLPSAPGVNPQGGIMALAKRNIERIILNS